MNVLATVVANLLALVALLLSAYMSVAWGEAGSFDVHGDKSALAGFGMVPMLMGMRWLSIALILAIAIWRGGFDFLPAPRWQQAAIVLGVHLALGYLAYRGFDATIAAIQRSDASSSGVAWLFGLFLPIIVLLVALWGVNRGWVMRRPAWGVAIAALVVWVHVAAWRQGYRQRATGAAPSATG